MRFDHNPQSFVQVRQALHTNGFSHQARHAITPFVIQALNHAGFSAAFLAGAMLTGRKPSRVSFVENGINQLAPISSRHRKPQFLQCLCAFVAHTPRQHLMMQARFYNPQVSVATLETIAKHQLINFQRIARNSRQNRIGKTHAPGLRLFLSTRRTVSRPALRVRAMARCDTRFSNALPTFFQSRLLFPH